ncbi:MAG: YitT family protein [Sphingobium sp.]|nr:YitT family protein [Sphingobium sp.]
MKKTESPTPVNPSPAPVVSQAQGNGRQGPVEDGYALFVSAIFIAMGLLLLQKAGLVTGGLAGVALLLSYHGALPFSVIFIGLSLPFMLFALLTMGRGFAVKTLILSVMIPAIVDMLPRFIMLDAVDQGAAAIMGGTLVGMGVMAAARHSASAGGVGVMALWCQNKGWMKAGYIQLGFDICVLILSAWRLRVDQVLWSAIGMVALSAILIVWHRRDRYIGY